MKQTKPKTPGRKPPPPPPKPRTSAKDPVEVYCRIRPLENSEENVCIETISNTTLRLFPPETSSAARNGNVKEGQYTFKFVFDEHISQKALFDHVALPLVTDLLHGKNGLLFTYGVTGSGKTYTMTGIPQNGGIMPRCLDVVFNSIGALQARKYVFKPDKMNGFDVQIEADAMLDRQKDLLTFGMNPRTPRAVKQKEETDLERIPDFTKVDNVEEDNNYAVFVSYIEIYNNYVYDLLDESPIDPIKPKPPQSKILREDSFHNMYVHGCVEVEVKSTEEAFDVFYRGQKRKRMAHTTLNTESSRSHSVFTIRLVQAPLDPMGEELLQDKNIVCISQLSLVDLAGSERTVRTKNTGDRLREAGNINNSLMVLKKCIEILRENQMQGTNKMVPYRDAKLTHLFKNYFDGEGKVRMIVCVNPRADDYDETIHVMRFAELTQEVQVARPQGLKFDNLGLTPGRRKANLRYKEAFEKLALEEGCLSDLPVLPPCVTYSIGPPFPSVELEMPSDDTTLLAWIQCLEEREICRRNLQNSYHQKQNEFRNLLLEMEKENCLLKQERDNLKQQLQVETSQRQGLKRRLDSSEHSNALLQRKLEEYKISKRTLECELDEKDMMITQSELEKEKIQIRMQDKLVSQRGRITREMERKMKVNQAKLLAEKRAQEEKLRTLRTIVNDDWLPGSAPVRPTLSNPNLAMPSTSGICTRSGKIQPSTSDPKLDRGDLTATSPPLTNAPVANPRHRRSRSGGEVWVDHRPQGSLELDTILQPSMKKRKSMNKLDADVITKDADRYCLTHQEQQRNGDIETKLIKGNVIPSVSGGAQVIFNEVEVLTQTSPPGKMNLNGQVANDERGCSTAELESRCAYGIGNHKITNGNKATH